MPYLQYLRHFSESKITDDKSWLQTFGSGGVRNTILYTTIMSTQTWVLGVVVDFREILVALFEVVPEPASGGAQRGVTEGVVVNALLPFLPFRLALLHATRNVFPVTVKYSCQEKCHHNPKIKMEIPALFLV